jgi:hypothetical protein
MRWTGCTGPGQRPTGCWRSERKVGSPARNRKFADSRWRELDSNFPYASAMNLVSPSQSQRARN